MTIWADRSGRSVVCGCTRCPQVRALAISAPEADAWITAHAQLHADDDARRAVTAAKARERRRDTPST